MAILAAVVGAFFLGHCNKPQPKVVTQTVYKDRVVTQTVEKKVEVKGETRQILVYRDRVVHKDGTVEEKTETHETVGKQERVSDDTKGHSDSVSQGTTTVTKSDAPRWHAMVGAGMTFEKTPSLRLMGEVDYRFAGPFVVGLLLEGDTQAKNLEGFVTLGVTF